MEEDQPHFLPELPTPPSGKPKDALSVLTSQRVIRAAMRIAVGASITASFRREGISATPTRWRKRAEDGDDPFYVWLITCLEIAEAFAISTVESALHESAVSGNVKAQEFFLKRRSDIYRESTDRATVGSASVTIGQIVQVIQNNPEAPGRLIDAGYVPTVPLELPERVDLQPEVLDEEPRKMALSRRAPVIEED